MASSGLCFPGYTLSCMPTAWEVELEAEVADWLASLDVTAFEVAEAHLDLLAEYGSTLRMPHSRTLGDGLFELRFDMTRRSWRIAYWFAGRRTIVLLTVFHKQRNNERHEIARARDAMTRCQGGHPQ
jgi:hypothetical protein